MSLSQSAWQVLAVTCKTPMLLGTKCTEVILLLYVEGAHTEKMLPRDSSEPEREPG